MLYEQAGDFPPFFFVDVQDESGHILHFFQVQAGQGFVKDQKVGFQGQRPAEFDSFLETIREHAHGFVTNVLYFQKVDDFFLDEGPVLNFLFGSLSNENGAADDTGAVMIVPSQSNIVEDGHSAEDFYFLKGPGHAHLGSLAWLATVDALSLEEDIPFPGMIKTVDAVHHHGLSGAVGSDDGMNFPSPDFEADTFQCMDFTKRHVEALEFQEDFIIVGFR